MNRVIEVTATSCDGKVIPVIKVNNVITTFDKLNNSERDQIITSLYTIIEKAILDKQASGYIRKINKSKKRDLDRVS